MFRASSSPQATAPSKKLRGRPLGSKNKDKLDYIAEPKSMTVNVPVGGDVIEYIMNVARRDHVSVVVLSASGTVARVLINNTLSDKPPLDLHGPFTIISLNGYYIYNNEYTLQTGATPPSLISFGINLCTSTGQIFGSAVHHRIVADIDGIKMVLSTFSNPSIYKQVTHPQENDTNNNTNNLSESATLCRCNIANKDLMM